MGWLAPAGTPKAAIDKLSAQIMPALKRQDVRERLVQMGIDPVDGTPAEFTKFLNDEIEKWGKVIKIAGVKVES